MTVEQLQQVANALQDVPHKWAAPIVNILNTLQPLTDNKDDKPAKPAGKKPKKD